MDVGGEVPFTASNYAVKTVDSTVPKLDIVLDRLEAINERLDRIEQRLSGYRPTGGGFVNSLLSNFGIKIEPIRASQQVTQEVRTADITPPY